MAVTKEETEAFAAARDAVLLEEKKTPKGIGTQSEKTVHAVLKRFLDSDPSHQEVPVGGYIADIFDGEQITEIQTGSFAPLRDKLKTFLPEYRVTIVHPIPHTKWITWIDPDTGELLEDRRARSPVTGSFYHAFRELYQIRPCLKDPNLRIVLLLVDMEEYRLQDGWSRDRKRGSHRYDRIPEALFDKLVLSGDEDYNAFLPEGLPREFTSSEFMALASRRKIRTVSGSTILRILAEQGVVLDTGKKKGRSILWTLPDKGDSTDDKTF